MADSTKVCIGLESARELAFEVEDAGAMLDAIDAAFGAGDQIVWIDDTKGHRHGIRTNKVAFVEVEAEDDTSGVGFGSGDS